MKKQTKRKRKLQVDPKQHTEMPWAERNFRTVAHRKPPDDLEGGSTPWELLKQFGKWVYGLKDMKRTREQSR